MSRVPTGDSCAAANLGSFDQLRRLIEPRADFLTQIVSWPDKTREWPPRGTGLASLSRITREWFASADDEVWVLSSDAESWRHMGGRAGLARVRKRVVIGAFVMVLN